MIKDGKHIGVECKRMDAPRLTPSMSIAARDLKLTRLIVLYPGPHSYSLAKNIQVVPLTRMLESPDDFIGI